MVSSKNGTKRETFRSKEAKSIAFKDLRFVKGCFNACLSRDNCKIFHVSHSFVFNLDLELELICMGVNINFREKLMNFAKDTFNNLRIAEYYLTEYLQQQ